MQNLFKNLIFLAQRTSKLLVDNLFRLVFLQALPARCPSAQVDDVHEL